MKSLQLLTVFLLMHMSCAAWGLTASPNPVVATTYTDLDLPFGNGNSWYCISAPAGGGATFAAGPTGGTRATFTMAGAYTLEDFYATDSYASISTVDVVVNASLASVSVSPSNASPNPSATQAFTATGLDQFGMAMASQPVFAWTASGGGTISSAGLFAAGATAGGPFAITATGGGVSGTATLRVNAAPTVATVASAAPSPVTGTTATLSVLGADDAGESGLTYTWTTTGTPPAAVGFSANGTNASKAITATFTKAGAYSFQVTIRDAGGLKVTSGVNVTVSQTIASLTVAPTGSRINPSATQAFTVSTKDQFGAVLATQPTPVWTTGGGGTVSGAGLFLAGSVSGTYSVTASSGGISGAATVTVNAAPTVASPAKAVPSPVSGTTTALSVLGSDDLGEGGLIYTWATTGTPPAAVTFSANGTNAAKSCTATFTKAGSYSIQTSIKDQGGLTTSSSVTFAVSQTLTSIAVSPTVARVNPNGTQAFTATAKDQFGSALASQPTVTWTASGGGTIASTGLLTAGATAGGSFTITAGAGGKSGTSAITINAAPTVATGAKATPGPVTGTSTALSVLGADDAGESGLTYSWATTGAPPAAVAFSANGTNAAKASTATFTKAGTYALQVTITDAGGLKVSSGIASLVVNQTLTTMVVSPTSTRVNPNGTRTFTASAKDQFGAALATQPTPTWAASGGGSMAATGIFTAGATPGGPYTITASAGGRSGTASAVVNAPPTVAAAAKASPSPVTGTTTTLSVLGADDAGESALIYTWATTGAPPAAVAFGASGTNSAKTSTATFTKAGTYAFQVTMRDGDGLSTTGSVSVIVSQTATSVGVSPTSIRLNPGQTASFVATVKDQFGVALANQPTITWSATGGTMAGAVYTAGATPGPYVVTASGGGKSGTASVVVNAAPTIAANGSAKAAPSPVSGSTTVLTALGADDAGESALIYTWSTTGTPPAPVAFSVNGTNAAKASTASFTKAGTYAFQVKIADAGGLSTTSAVTVTVDPTPTSVVAAPASASVVVGLTQQFTATVKDQFGALIASPPTLTWTVGGGGAISSAGLFTAGTGTGGPFTVTAACAGKSATASITVTNAAPTIATNGAATASPNPVTGTTAVLSALGADDGTEGRLTYAWAAIGTPPAAVTFSPNGTNAAKSSTASFAKTGSYTFQVTIRDAGGLTVSSSVTVTAVQTLATVAISPSSASVIAGRTQQFTATGKDQFGIVMAAQPSFTWTASGGGTVSSAGLFTAGTTVGGPFTVTASGAGKSAGASVTVLSPLPSIATQPVNATVALGATATFSISATGPAPLAYQWSRSGDAGSTWASISGATSAAYTTPATVAGDTAAKFRCAVSNTAGSVVSSSATLTVLLRTAQSITFLAPPTPYVGAAARDLTATSTSGLPVAFSSSNSAIIAVSGTTMSIVSAGTATITATQAGDTTYAPAVSVLHVVTVLPDPAPVVTYQKTTATTADLFGALPAIDPAVTGLTVASQTAGVTATGRLEGDDFTVHLAATGQTSAVVSVRFTFASGVTGPALSQTVAFTAGSSGDPGTLPPAQPTVTLAIDPASLTGDKTGTVNGQTVNYSNKTAITVKVNAATDIGTVASIQIVSSDGQSLVISGASGSAALVMAEGTWQVTAIATASNGAVTTTGTTTSPITVIVDRTPPMLTFRLPVRYWGPGLDKNASPLPFVPLRCSLTKDQDRVLLNGNADSDNAPLRDQRHMNVYDIGGYTSEALVTSRSGLTHKSTPYVLAESLSGGGGGQLTGAVVEPAAPGDPQVLVISGFDALPDSQIDNQFANGFSDVDPYLLSADLVDRAGNPVEVDAYNLSVGTTKPNLTGSTTINAMASPGLIAVTSPYVAEVWQDSVSDAQHLAPGQLNVDLVELGGAFNTWLLNSPLQLPVRTDVPIKLILQDAFGNRSAALTQVMHRDPAVYTDLQSGGQTNAHAPIVGQTSYYFMGGGPLDSLRVRDPAVAPVVTVEDYSTGDFELSLLPSDGLRNFWGSLSNGLLTGVGAGDFSTWSGKDDWTTVGPIDPGQDGAQRRCQPAVVTVPPSWQPNPPATHIRISDNGIANVLALGAGQPTMAPQGRNGLWTSAAIEGTNAIGADVIIGREGIAAAGAAASPGLSSVDYDIPGPAINAGVSAIYDYANTGYGWLNFIQAAPDIVTAGTRTTIRIQAGFLNKGFTQGTFDPKGDYVHFMANGSDCTQKASAYDPSADPSTRAGLIAIAGQRLIAEGPDSSVKQSLELDLDIGPAVHAAICDIDVKLGAIKAYSDSLSAATAGANGAHRMKQSLGVVAIAHEIQGQQTATTFGKSFSAPMLTASVGAVGTSGTTLSVALSGSVQDKYAGLVKQSALRSVRIWHGSDHVGDLALTSVSDAVSDWAPFAKHFTFSGTVTMPAWVGADTLSIETDANEMGAHGEASVAITLSGMQPVPALLATITITAGTFNPSAVDAITLIAPNTSAGGVAQAVPLTETGAGTLVFSGTGGVTVTMTAPQPDSGAPGQIFANVEANGSLLYSGAFVETGVNTHVYQRTDAWTPAIGGSTTLAYTATWGAAWKTGTTMQLALPAAIAGSGAPPVTLTGNGGSGAGSFTGTFAGNPVLMTAQVSGSASQISITVNGSLVGYTTVPVAATAAAGSATASYVITDPSQVVSYSVAAVGAIAAGNEDVGSTGWTPYRVRVDVPAVLGDAFVSGRTWTMQGNQATVAKANGAYYVQDSSSGKPAVFLDPAVTPTADPPSPQPVPAGTPAADPPLPDGWVAFSGSAGGASVVAYVHLGGVPPPATVTVEVQYVNDGSDRIMNKWVTGLPDADQYQHISVTTTGTHSIHVSVPCSPQTVQATPGTLVGRKSGDIASQVLSGYIKTFVSSSAGWQWIASAGSGGSGGWVWTQGQDDEISPIPALWTIPQSDGPGTVAIADAVAKALGETSIPIPSANLASEKKRILLSNMIAMVGMGIINHFDADQATALYVWMLAHVFDATQNAGPVFRGSYLTYGALSLGKVVDGYNNDPANLAAVAARKAKNAQRAKYGQWVFQGEKFSTAEPYLLFLQTINQFADPLSAATTIGSGEPIMAKDEHATWAAVALTAGYLVIDRIPFGRLARKAKTMFRRSTSLPGEAREIRQLAREETVVIGRRVKNIVERDAADVNAELATKGISSAPYAQGTKVIECTLDEDVAFVRYWTPGFNKPPGQWIALSSDAGGLTKDQIKQYFCLPKVPTHWAVVKVPKGTKIRKGITAKQPEWGCPEDGGTQYQLLDRISTDNFLDMGPLP